MTFPAEIEFIVSQNDKGNNPKRPDYRGEVKIAGKTYELAAWRRTKQGTTRQFVSGKLKLKTQDAQPGDHQAGSSEHEEHRQPASSSRPAHDANLDEDVPF